MPNCNLQHVLKLIFLVILGAVDPLALMLLASLLIEDVWTFLQWLATVTSLLNIEKLASLIHMIRRAYQM